MSYEQTAVGPDYLFKDVCRATAWEDKKDKGQMCLLSVVMKIMSPYMVKIRQTYCLF